MVALCTLPLWALREKVMGKTGVTSGIFSVFSHSVGLTWIVEAGPCHPRFILFFLISICSEVGKSSVSRPLLRRTEEVQKGYLG